MSSPAYEDPAHWVLAEAQLPDNVDPVDSKLADPEARARMARVFERGLDAVSGYVLPVQRWNAEARGGWISERWRFRRARLFLVPGDSPLGFRMPLTSLPHVPPASFPHIIPADPTAPRGSLPARAALAERARPAPALAAGRDHAPQPLRQVEGAAENRQQQIEQEMISGVVRTAIAFEMREGILCAFMPPVATRRGLSRAPRGRGGDRRARNVSRCISRATRRPTTRASSMIKVTPDPGVIEVNVQPAETWRDCVDITATLYEDARQSRLGTDKFMIDGRHVGTGGGNHVVLGGATPADSPFLRRPDLLKSLVLYWQRHPSLSYLFSRHVHRPDEPGAARRRGAARQRSTSSRSPWTGSAARRGRARRPGWSTASSATF